MCMEKGEIAHYDEKPEPLVVKDEAEQEVPQVLAEVEQEVPQAPAQLTGCIKGTPRGQGTD